MLLDINQGRIDNVTKRSAFISTYLQKHNDGMDRNFLLL